MDGRDCDSSMHDAIIGFYCCHVTTCQLSGSRSNSLNLRKLPGCFSHGLGTKQHVDRFAVAAIKHGDMEVLWILKLSISYCQ